MSKQAAVIGMGRFGVSLAQELYKMGFDVLAIDKDERVVQDLTGQLTFGQFGALLERCDLFIGHDTGAMHLAVAVGAPVVAIFGPSDPRMYGPYGENSVALWHDVGCNPCLLRGRWDTTCRRFRCIEAVTVEEVWQAAAALL